jgi:hypothetical protein
MTNVTCGEVLRPCRGDGDILGRYADLGRRFALPQATLNCPFWAEMQKVDAREVSESPRIEPYSCWLAQLRLSIALRSA